MSQSLEVEALPSEALQALPDTLGSTHPITLVSIDNCAALLRSQDKFSEAGELLRDAVLLKDEGKFSEAEALYGEALQGLRTTLGNMHPHTLSSINNQ